MCRRAQGIQGVRFKRVIMDEDATDRSPHPPAEPGYKRLVFCSGKVRGAAHAREPAVMPAISLC